MISNIFHAGGQVEAGEGEGKERGDAAVDGVGLPPASEEGGGASLSAEITHPSPRERASEQPSIWETGEGAAANSAASPDADYLSFDEEDDVDTSPDDLGRGSVGAAAEAAPADADRADGGSDAAPGVLPLDSLAEDEAKSPGAPESPVEMERLSTLFEKLSHLHAGAAPSPGAIAAHGLEGPEEALHHHTMPNQVEEGPDVLTIGALTWNLTERIPRRVDLRHIGEKFKDEDIVVIGVQRLFHVMDGEHHPWADAVLNHVNQHRSVAAMHIVKVHTFRNIQCAVFATKAASHAIMAGSVQASAQPCRRHHFHLNRHKGAVVVSFNIGFSHLRFVVAYIDKETGPVEDAEVLRSLNSEHSEFLKRLRSNALTPSASVGRPGSRTFLKGGSAKLKRTATAIMGTMPSPRRSRESRAKATDREAAEEEASIEGASREEGPGEADPPRRDDGAGVMDAAGAPEELADSADVGQARPRSQDVSSAKLRVSSRVGMKSNTLKKFKATARGGRGRRPSSALKASTDRRSAGSTGRGSAAAPGEGGPRESKSAVEEAEPGRRAEPSAAADPSGEAEETRGASEAATPSATTQGQGGGAKAGSPGAGAGPPTSTVHHVARPRDKSPDVEGAGEGDEDGSWFHKAQGTSDEEWQTVSGNAMPDFNLVDLLQAHECNSTLSKLRMTVKHSRPSVIGLRTAADVGSLHSIDFLLGDLNCTLQWPRRQLDELLQLLYEGGPENIREVLKTDTLRTEKYDEGAIYFRPSGTYALNSQAFTKGKAPAYSDRILYRVQSGEVDRSVPIVATTRYELVPSCTTSRHRPVVATFRVVLHPAAGRAHGL